MAPALPPALALMVLLAPMAWAAGPVVLPYEGRNKWVAAPANAPLRMLVTQVRSGTRNFGVELPASDRELAVTRLLIVRDMLVREAKGAGVVLEESNGQAPANTLRFTPRR